MNKYIMKKIEELIPYANNAKKHSEEQITKVASSIKEFGFINPVIIDKDNGIIAGHCRVLAAKKLKLKEAPCLQVEHLTEAQKKAYILADNKLAELGEWDMNLVNIELESLKEFNFDFELTGFEYEQFEPKLPDDDDKKPELKDKFLLIIELENEQEQETLFAELRNRNYEVKIP